MHIQKSKTDLKFNVAQLLREMVGARREYHFAEGELELDETLTLQALKGIVRFTRTTSGVLANVHASSTIAMECIRCLAPTTQPVEIEIKDEFHSKVEVNTGMPLPKPDEEDPFFIDETHMIDLGEVIREYGLMAVPMQPLCKTDCKGLCPTCGADLNVEACTCEQSEGDSRFAALKSLLQ